MEEKRTSFDLSAAGLHIIAMALMLCDHTWATLASNQEWLTCIGRIAFPIFAFMIAEGYHYTKNINKYMLRLFVFALISEVPFNLMTSGSVIYPLHQNVLWTFLIALLMIRWIERPREKGKKIMTIITAIAAVLVGQLLGIVAMVDYFNAGVVTVIMFYFLRGRKWYHFAAQLVGLYYINFEMLGGLSYIFDLFGREIWFPQQGLAILALIPIWLYRGRQGHHSRAFKYACYAFYPAHMLALYMLAMVK